MRSLTLPLDQLDSRLPTSRKWSKTRYVLEITFGDFKLSGKMGQSILKFWCGVPLFQGRNYAIESVLVLRMASLPLFWRSVHPVRGAYHKI